MEYEQLLERARKNMPSVVFERERFAIPKVVGRLEGNKTLITNFTQIVQTLRRPMEHILKFLLKQLASPGDVRGGFLILGTKIPATRINDKIKEYAIEFVLCTDCGKPDTEIKKESEFNYLKCTACGSKHLVKSVL